jgi:alpha-glucosidase
MENNDPKRPEDVKDPIGRLGWPKEKGRDGERTPMQWDAGPSAGFTSATPWLPVPASYATHNVATEQDNPDSVLQFYEHLLALRHRNQALLDGSYVALNRDDPEVLSYLREYKDKVVLVVLNMSATGQQASFDLTAQGFSGHSITTLLTTATHKKEETTTNEMHLEPFEVYIGTLSK